MKRTEVKRPKMDVDAIDRILAAEEEIAPSSGFATAVMERVREEAAAPAPIPFPWKRFAPGLVMAAGVMGWGAWELVRSARMIGYELTQNPPPIPVAAMPQLEETGWVVLALAVSWGAWMLSTRMVRRSGML
jgi:hypothetical protein